MDENLDTKENVENLNHSFRSFVAELNFARVQIKDLKAENLNLTQTKMELSHALQTSNRTNKDLRVQLEIALAAVGKLETESLTIREKLSSQNVLLRTIVSERNELTEKLHNEQCKMVEKGHKITELEEQIQILSKKRNSVTEYEQKIEKSLLECTVEVERLENEHKTLVKEVQNSGCVLNKMAAAFEYYRNLNEKCEKEKVEAMNNVLKLKSELDILKDVKFQNQNGDDEEFRRIMNFKIISLTEQLDKELKMKQEILKRMDTMKLFQATCLKRL